MPEAQPVSAKKRFPGGYIGVIFTVLLLLASCVFFLRGVVAAGFEGTHGSFLVKECYPHKSSSRTSGSSSHSYDCDGVFRSDDGKVVDDKASLGSLTTDYHDGVRLSVQGPSDNAVFKAVAFGGGGYILTSQTGGQDLFLAFGLLFLVICAIVAWRMGVVKESEKKSEKKSD